MNLVVIAACFAVCQGAKLNRGYLPPESAKTAGGDGDILQTPFRSQEPLQDKSLPTRLPVGSYVNEFEGVVIDADSAGTRATHSGLGNPRETYGSTDSKVGEAAFRESILNANKGINKQGGQNVPPNVNTNNAKNKQHGHVLPNVAGVRQPLLQPGGHQIPVLEAERFHASRDRASNIINYQNDIGITDFNYAFQTDNGISAAEIGMAMDGVKSKGGYSYTGDDGQVYTISYTADEAGYRPQGSHIPTPPPIPAEILKALEQNAKDEAAGIVDDGSYDAKKYNTDRTKGNKPDNKHNTFERRPAFNVISTINQNSQTNKPNRDEDNRSNGQNQFPNVNPQYTVNDKLISNFTNIRNQYENEFDVLTNNKFNNNGPISNFKDLDDATSDGKNQSQNVPLSQQKLQDKIEVPNSNGRPNSYQAPISAIQNQQQNNQNAFQTQSQIQFRPNTFQSINGANNKQQALNKPNGFVNSNNFQSRPNSYHTQTSGLVQEQQNFNKKGSIFQTQFQNNFNANQQNQQSFSSGISSTQFNTNSQQANKLNNNLPNLTFNKQGNSFSKQTIPQAKPSSYDASTPSINQNQVTNVGNSFSTATQNRPTSYDVSISGSNTANQKPTTNLNNVFSNQIATQKIPITSDGTFQKQQSIVNSESLLSNPITPQSRPASYDASITKYIQNQQSIANSGNILSTPILTQPKPQTSFSEAIQDQQKIGNFGNVFPRPTQAQSRPSSYDASIAGNNIQKQQSITNSGNFFSTQISTQAKPNLQASTSGIIQNQLHNGNFGNVVLSSPTQIRAKPTSFEASITGNVQNQQFIANSGNILSTPNPTSASVSGTIQNNQENGNMGNLFSRPIQTQARPTSYEASSGNIQKQQSIANSGNIFSTPNQNQANLHAPSSGKIQQQQQNGNFANFFSRPTQTPARPNSYDSSISGTFYQKQQVTNNDAFSKLTTIQPGPTLTTSSEEFVTTDNSSPQQLTAQGKPGSQFSNSANSGQSLDGQYEGELYDYPKPDTNLASGSPATANTQKPSFPKPSTFQTRPNSFDASFTGAIQQQQQQQYFFNLPNVNQYENKDNANKQNEMTDNQGVTSAQFIDVSSQHVTPGNNGAFNGNTGGLSFNNQDNIFSKPTSERTNSQTITGVNKQQQSNYVHNANKFQDNLNTNQQNLGTFTSGVTSVQFSNSNSQQTNIDSNSSNGNFARPANSQINVFNNKVKTEDTTTEGGIQHQQPQSVSDITNQFQNEESGNQQNSEGVTSTQYNIQDTTENNINVQFSDSLSQFSSNIPASPNFGSSFVRPSQSFGYRPTFSEVTLNAPTSNDNDHKHNIGLVAISSSNLDNDDFGSNFLHKKYSIKKQQELNQQGFSNFLQSNNVANAPVVLSSNYNNQYSTAQPSFGFSNLNSGSNAYQNSPLKLLSSSQLSQPNPTPQTFGVTGSDKLFTAAPSRVLSTPKDTIEVSQGTSGITQASISPFPSLAPFSKDSGNSNSVSQTGSLSSQAIGSSLGVNLVPSHSQEINLGLILGLGNTGSSVNTQNQGEVYEYPKPEPNLPNPTKAPEKSDLTNNSPSTVNSNSQIELNNPIPTISSEIPQNTKTESGPKRLPSRPNIISSTCCFSSQNTESSKNSDSTGLNSDSKTSTFHNGKEEFEGPKSPQTYDETGYHY